jgi:hypothetical protein
MSVAPKLTVDDSQRERWRRSRQRLRLVDIADPAFATGGAGRRVEALALRVVIQPCDPEAQSLEFSADWWNEWLCSSPDIIPPDQTLWGSYSGATQDLWTRCVRPSEGGSEYAGFNRAGTFDAGLGPSASREVKGAKYFMLVDIVGRIWVACHAYSTMGNLGIGSGPWEVTVALKGTEKAALAGFARGWSSPLEWGAPPDVCFDPNVLIRRETNVLSSEWAQMAAFSIGRQIENAFGSRSERFRLSSGGQLGHFDVQSFRR